MHLRLLLTLVHAGQIFHQRCGKANHCHYVVYCELVHLKRVAATRSLAPEVHIGRGISHVHSGTDTLPAARHQRIRPATPFQANHWRVGNFR